MTDTNKSAALAQLIQSGSAHFQAGRFSEAEAACHQALAVDAENAAALDLLGRIALKAGQLQRAAEFFNRALALNPNDAKVYRDLGMALATQGDWAAALVQFRRALEIDPAYADGHIGAGNAYFAQEHFEEALACYRRALQITPESAKAHGNLGIVLQRLGRLDEAVECYQRALSHDPDFIDAYKNLASVFQNLGRLDEAIACANKLMQLQPGSALVQGKFAPLLLLYGDLERGLALYESRFGGADKSLMALLQRNLARLEGKPRWQGEALQERRLFVWREQGFGDGIMMARYLPLLKAKGAGEVIVSCWPEMMSLLGTLPEVDRVVDDREALPPQEFDCHCPIMSLPYLFGTRLDTIPDTVPYFNVPRVMAEKWTQRLAPLEGLKVGLVWSGHKNQRKDMVRSIPFEHLKRLLALPGIRFVSLQKDEAENDAALLDWMAECEDFLDTAALVQPLDLVISVDTAVAHLAGALGRPVWLLNRFESEWRWMLEREDSPWYPTMRIFRQPALHDWGSVIQEVAEELGRLVARQAGN